MNLSGQLEIRNAHIELEERAKRRRAGAERLKICRWSLHRRFVSYRPVEATDARPAGRRRYLTPPIVTTAAAAELASSASLARHSQCSAASPKGHDA